MGVSLNLGNVATKVTQVTTDSNDLLERQLAEILVNYNELASNPNASRTIVGELFGYLLRQSTREFGGLLTDFRQGVTSSGAAPAQGALGSGNNGQAGGNDQHLQQENAALRQMVADMLSAAHVHPRQGRQVLDDKDDILRRLEEQHNWAQSNYGNTVAMTDDEIKQTQVYKDLDAEKAAAETAKTTAENAKTAAEGKITTITPIATNIKALVAKGKLGKIGDSMKLASDDYSALEEAAKDLVDKLAASPTTP